MLIPYKELDNTTLINIIEQYILREGTDYGITEASLEDKVQQLLIQIENQEIYINYSELNQTVTLISKYQLQENISPQNIDNI